MKVVAIDTETKLIAYPNAVNPDLICVTWYIEDGQEAVIRHHNDPRLEEELRFLFTTCTIVGHNVAFDLHVLLKKFPSLIQVIWSAIKAGRILDTMLQQKLINLGTEGDVDYVKCSLGSLVAKYFDEDIQSDKEDASSWRFRYAELEHFAIAEWPAEAVQYAKSDAVYTYRVSKAQQFYKTCLQNAHIHVASHFALRAAEIGGIRIDTAKVTAIKQELADKLAPLRVTLVEAGLIRSNGTQDKKRLGELCEEWGITTKTKTGKTSSSKKILGLLECSDPLYKAYMEYASLQKLVTTFIPQLSVGRIHPKYNPIVNTLRTSCFSSDYYKGGKSPVPSVNLQQIPRSGTLRACFMPEEGHKIICMDYANLELACAAQSYFNFFGSSKMRDVLNTGKNLHTHLGRILYNDLNKTNVTMEEYETLLHAKDPSAKMARQTAKPINLGCPGGQSAPTIRRTASEAYGVKISMEQAEAWAQVAMGEYPEISKFFAQVLPTYEKGKMLIKDAEGNFKTVKRYDITPFGSPRVKCTYCAAANGMCMQTLGAIGKKIALARLYECISNPAKMSMLYGCRLLIDMHDEIAISCPYDIVGESEEEMAMIMLTSMHEVLPDMRIAVESMILTRWAKDPEVGFPSKEFHLDPKSSNVI